jgi:hypothetical protein
MRLSKLIMCGVLLGAVAWSNAAAGISPDKSDGWHTWQVDEPGASTEMCCFAWKKGNGSRSGCNLDGKSVAFTDSGDCAAAPGTIQVYVKYKGGIPEDIRVLSSNCPVSSESEIADHGLVSVDENISWFRDIIENKRLDMDIREDALLGLVQSESDAAFDYLDSLLSQR